MGHHHPFTDVVRHGGLVIGTMEYNQLATCLRYPVIIISWEKQSFKSPRFGSVRSNSTTVAAASADVYPTQLYGGGGAGKQTGGQ